MEFKDKLRKLRLEAGLSQEALADSIHISRSAIAKYENGNGNPSEDTLKTLAAYFGVEVSNLKSDEIIKSNSTKKKKIKNLSIICGLVLLFGIILSSTIAIVNVNMKDGINNKMEFSSEKWKEKNYYERYLMLESLASKYDLVGYSGEDLVDLLGLPDSIQIFYLDTDHVQYGGNDFMYFVDSHRYTGVPEWLSVKISIKSIVLSCNYECNNEDAYSIY